MLNSNDFAVLVQFLANVPPSDYLELTKISLNAGAMIGVLILRSQFRSLKETVDKLFDHILELKKGKK